MNFVSKLNEVDAALAFRRLRNLKAEYEAVLRGDELIVIMIAACIEEGMSEGKQITGAMAKLGFKKRYAGLILHKERGNDPKRHCWSRDVTGIYKVNYERLGLVSAADTGIGEPFV